MKKFALAAMLAVGLSAGAAHAAESVKGPYVGAGLDYSHFAISGVDADLDKSNFGLSTYAGYRFNDIVAAELGYTKLGDLEIKGPGLKVPVDNSMWSASALAYAPVADKTEVFGRLGLAHVRSEVLGHSTSDTAPLLGLGVEHQLNKTLSVRAEVQYVPDFIDSADLVNTSVSLKARF